MKRMIQDNLGPGVTLNNERFSRALLILRTGTLTGVIRTPGERLHPGPRQRVYAQDTTPRILRSISTPRSLCSKCLCPGSFARCQCPGAYAQEPIFKS